MNELKSLIEELSLTDVEIDIDENTRFLDDLLYFSFEMFNLISALEDEYDVYLEESEVRKMSTVGDMLRVLEEQGLHLE